MKELLQPIVNFTLLNQRNFIVLALSSWCVFLATVFFPDEFQDQFSFIRPVAFTLAVASSAALLVGVVGKMWSAGWRNLGVPFTHWATAKIKSKKLKKQLLELDLDEVVELAKARRDGNPHLSLVPYSRIARNLHSKRIIERSHQTVKYDPAFRVDELAWDLVLGMQEFEVANGHWLTGISGGQISIEEALRNSDTMLPVLHPTVKHLLQAGEKDAD